MKIIKLGGFNRRIGSDLLIAENVNGYYAKFLVELLNKGDFKPLPIKCIV